MAALVVPLAALDLLLQALRITAHFDSLVPPSAGSWLLGISLSGSSFFFDAGFALLTALLLLVRDQESARWVAVAALFQLLAFLIGVIDVAAYGYYVQTVDALDWPLLQHMLGLPRDLVLVVGGEATAGQWSIFGAMALGALAAPWLLRRWLLRNPDTLYRGRERRSLRGAHWAAALALPVMLLGLLPPPVQLSDPALVRSPVLHILETALPSSRAQAPAEELESARFFVPRELTLERVKPGPLRNVVFIILESTRARSTTPYNPQLPSTPFLAALAADSLVVEKAYVVIPATTKALTAIFCSIYPSLTLEPRSLNLGLLGRCLPRLLAEQGYQTMFMQGASPNFDNRARSIPNMGFQSFITERDIPHQGFQEANFLGFEDEAMLGPSEEWLRAHKDKPFLAAYLTLDAHHEYRRLTRRGIFHLAPPSGDDDDSYDRYLNNIRYEDGFLQQLFAQYKREGAYENTLFVLVGDHGEGFGEHARRAHNTVLNEEGIRVPLIFHDPSHTLFQPGRLPGPVSELDVMPTVLDLLGYKTAHGALHGMNIFQSPRDRVLMLSCFGECAARVTDTEAYIHHFGRRPDELYDLRTDPLEYTDLTEKFPLIASRRTLEITAFQKRVANFFYFQTLRARSP